MTLEWRKHNKLTIKKNPPIIVIIVMMMMMIIKSELYSFASLLLAVAVN